MKLKVFAMASDISYGRMVRAAHKLGMKLNGPPRLGGTDVTEEEQAKLLKYFEDQGRVSKSPVITAKRYSAMRTGWLEDYHGAIKKEADLGMKGPRLLAIYGVVSIATSREMLDMPIDGSTLGDLAVEMCFSAGVDLNPHEPGKWKGFTGYLVDEGFESRAWGVL